MENARRRSLPRPETVENVNPKIGLFGYNVMSAIGGITCKLIWWKLVVLMYLFSIKN